tara:strand:+ start:1977 stop:3080 length:1104 start_codon:yes stop_codon:yes gene_type:complete
MGVVLVAIATTNQYWTSRMNGGNPASLTDFGQDNESFTLTGTGSDGSAVGDSWQIANTGSGQLWSLTPTTNEYTMIVCFKYTAAPADGTVLLKLDNGTHKAEVQASSDANKVKLVGTSTVISRDLDLSQADGFDAVPIILRLTLDSTGKARLYMREIIEDSDAQTNYLEVTGSTGSSKTIQWGNTDGTILWNNVYVTNMGAFSPDELSTSSFVSDSLIRMGLSVVDLLQKSKRFFLKNIVNNSSIVYGYDISSQMISRLSPPTIHVILQSLESPEFDTLGGTRITQNFKVILFITTRGTDYENAYRTAMEIAGDAFDELYTNTGLQGNTDSLIDYTITFDTKTDDDEVICVHRMELTYMRRLNLLHR